MDVPGLPQHTHTPTHTHTHPHTHTLAGTGYSLRGFIGSQEEGAGAAGRWSSISREQDESRDQ